MEPLINPVTITNVKVDTLKFGTAMLVAQLLIAKPLNDATWIKTTILTIIGLAFYQIIIKRIFNPNTLTNITVRAVITDMLKWGSMLAFVRLTSGQSMSDEPWIRETSYLLVGLATFDIATSRLIDISKFDRKIQFAMADIIKYGTAFGVARWLSGEQYTKEWATATGGFILGLVGYDLVLSDI